MNRRELLFKSTLAVTAPDVFLAGCGGGGSGGSPASNNTGALTVAKSFSQFTLALLPDSNSQTILAPYNNDFSTFGTPAQNITQGTLPFQSGLYTNIAATNYPSSPNGRFRITKDAAIPRHGIFTGIDLITGATGQGLAQSFYGVKAVTASPRVLADGRSLTNADVVLIVELIVSYQGVDLYRGVQVYRGFIYNWNTLDSTRDYASGTLLFHGSYVLNNIQIINQNQFTPALGVIESYDDYIQISALA